MWRLIFTPYSQGRAVAIVSSPRPTAPGWGHESPKLELDSASAQAPAELNLRQQKASSMQAAARLFTVVMEQILLYTDSWREWLGKSMQTPFMEASKIKSRSFPHQHPSWPFITDFVPAQAINKL